MSSMAVQSAMLGLAPPTPGLLFGLMLLSAIVGGYLARLVHLPRVIGFLLAGVGLRALLMAGVGDGGSAALDESAEPLSAIKDLALGVILFTIGGLFERSKVMAVSARVARISLLETSLVAGFVLLGCFAACLIAQPGYGATSNLVFAVLLGLAGIATAPAATLFVLQEYEAKGPITDTILGLTAVNNVVCIVGFYVVFLALASFGAIEASAMLASELWLALALTTLGSVALGVVLGVVLSIAYSRLSLAETLLVFFTMMILLGAGEKWLIAHRGVSFNSLLTTLVVGGVFANVAVDAQKLVTSVRTFGSPILVGFFVMAGFGLHIADLTHMGWVGGAYVLCRIAGKSLGCMLGVRWAKQPAIAGHRLGGALLCQAAVVIGLASFVKDNWGHIELAHQFSTVVLGSVVVFELLGPLLVKRCVVQGGEVKATTLLRRPGGKESSSTIARTMRSLVNMLTWRGGREDRTSDEISVQHIMRANVQLIPAAAPLDDVLHFIERSTHSHFPVVRENGELAGVIHFADVRDVIYDPILRDLVTAIDLADPNAVSVKTDVTLTDLLEVFKHQNVAVLPVVDDHDSKKIIGLVEQRDLLRALHLSKDGA